MTTMNNEPLEYPPLPEDLERGLSWRSLKYFGAGAIIASVTIGSGETLFASRGGAIFGYALLWCFVASALMKGAQLGDDQKQRIAERVAGYTGLSTDYVLRANLRLSTSRFTKELLRDRSRC